MCNDAGELVGGVCAYCNGIVGVSGGFSVAVATPDLGVEGAVEHQLHNGQVMITLDDVPCDLSECPKPDGRTTNDCDAYLAAHDLPKLGDAPYFVQQSVPPRLIEARGQLELRVKIFDSLGSSFSGSLMDWILAMFPQAQVVRHGAAPVNVDFAACDVNACSYTAARVLQGMLLDPPCWFSNSCDDRDEQRWTTDGNKHLLESGDPSIKERCVCHKRPLEVELLKVPERPHYLKGTHVLDLVKHWCGSTCVNLLYGDSICRAIVSAMERMLEQTADPFGVDVDGERVRFCCVNTEAQGSRGSHWVTVAFGFSRRPVAAIPRIHLPRRVTRRSSDVVNCDIGNCSFDSELRQTCGERRWIDLDGSVYAMTCMDSFVANSLVLVCGELILVWSVTQAGEYVRHVVITCSSFKNIGYGLYNWSSCLSSASFLGQYSGKVALYDSDKAATLACSAMSVAQREYVMQCRRNGAHAVIDAAEDKYSFLRYVNDPRGLPVMPNAYFTKGGQLLAEFHIPAFDLHKCPSCNKAAELFVQYAQEGGYSFPELPCNVDLCETAPCLCDQR